MMEEGPHDVDEGDVLWAGAGTQPMVSFWVKIDLGSLFSGGSLLKSCFKEDAGVL